MKDNIRLLITLLVCSFLPSLSSSTAINSEHYVMGFGSCLTEKENNPSGLQLKKKIFKNLFLWEITYTEIMKKPVSSMT